MATVILGELTEERRGSIAGEGNTREYTRAWLVESDDQYVGQLAVLATVGLPQLYLTVYQTDLETDAGARVVSLEAEPVSDHWQLWKVTVKYSSKWHDQAKNDPNPLLRPAVLSWSTLKYQKPAEKDINDDAIVNSADEPFDPPTPKDAHRLQLRIQKNYNFFPFPTASTYLNSVNELDFHGFGPGKVKLDDISSEEKWEDTGVYDAVTFTFSIDSNGWTANILDQGYSELLIDGTQVPILIGGVVPSKPVLLDGDGARLDLDVQEPFFHEYEIYETKDFGALGIPT